MPASIRIPPMVGVPAFEICVFGPSSLICCVRLKLLSLAITKGASINVSREAVIAARTVLNVMYRNTLNGK
ncbi:hypothetical protein BMS3Bbin07_01559 [bacterium BMS3Bbin07]|nr:hypothetical protein BMS3Bbin07_01559 [bacterium BMS3Bbin07]